MNEFYNPTPNVPPEHTQSNPDAFSKAQFAAIGAGFDRCPPLAAQNRHRIVKVNAAEDGLTLGPGYQERSMPMSASASLLTIDTTQTVAIPGLQGMRIDAGQAYRVDGHFTWSGTAAATAMALVLNFSTAMRRVHVLGISKGDDLMIEDEHINSQLSLSMTFDVGAEEAEIHGFVLSNLTAAGTLGISAILKGLPLLNFGFTIATAAVRLTQLVAE